jgi:hypothetical protein
MVSADDRMLIDQRRTILTQEQPCRSNGGHMAFGLMAIFVAFGDGGSGGDRSRAQIIHHSRQILHVDVDNGDPYTVRNNPFVGQQDAAPEIWA